MKKWLVKLVQWSLIAHGWLHIVEFGTALYEEAYITASLAAFGATTMIVGGMVLGEGHHHHHFHKHEEE